MMKRQALFFPLELNDILSGKMWYPCSEQTVVEWRPSRAASSLGIIHYRHVLQ